MAIDDNASYELTGAQVKDLANKNKAKAADNIFVGATSAAPGSKGLVPQPQAGDNTKFLAGDGTWKTVSGGGGSATTLLVVDAGTIRDYPAYYETNSSGQSALMQLVFPNNFIFLTEDGHLISFDELRALAGRDVFLKINCTQMGQTQPGYEAFLGRILTIDGSAASNQFACVMVYANSNMAGIKKGTHQQQVTRVSDGEYCPTVSTTSIQ